MRGYTRAAIFTVLAIFAFFEFYIWASLYKMTAGLAILIGVELLIGAAGMTWIRWESRKALQSTIHQGQTEIAPK